MPSIAQQFTDDFRLIAQECTAILSGEYGEITDSELRDDVEIILQAAINVYDLCLAHIFTDWTDSKIQPMWLYGSTAPLNSVIGYAMLIREAPADVYQNLSAGHISAVQAIEHAGKRHLALLNDVFSWVELHKDAFKPHTDTFNLMELQAAFPDLTLPVMSQRLRGDIFKIRAVFRTLLDLDSTSAVVEHHPTQSSFRILITAFRKLDLTIINEVMQPGWTPNPGQDTPQVLSLHIAAGYARVNGGHLDYLGDGVFDLRLQLVEES